MSVTPFNPFRRFQGEIRIISPATPPSLAKLPPVLKLFNQCSLDYQVSKKLFSHAEKRKKPAKVEVRAFEFNAALDDPNVKMILCSRGGYGSSDILPLIDWAKLRTRNIIVMGFSDITAIHLAMLKNKAGIPIAGPMLSDIPQSFKRNYAGLSLEKAILGDKKNFDISKYNRLEVIKSARSEGRVIAANLTVLCSLIGTKYMPDLRGCILLIEDINELDYKIHRSMSQLYFSGILNEINALLLGNFKNCGTRADMKIIFANFAKYVRGPIIYGLPFGHIKRILSLRLGTNTFVSDAGNVIFN